MKRILLPVFLILSLILAACSATSTPLPTAPQPAPVSTEVSQSDSGDLTRMDQQGAVVMEITPLNLGASAKTLEFDVKMNTHSVDLGMDLATFSTLTTDSGVTIQATKWDAPRGGHHVSGKLIFASLKDGKSILEGATKLTLTIVNVDASSRIFEWDLK